MAQQVLGGVGLGGVGLGGVGLGGVGCAGPEPVEAAPFQLVERQFAVADAAQRLGAAIRIETVSTPEQFRGSTFRAFHQHLKEAYPAAHQALIRTRLVLRPICMPLTPIAISSEKVPAAPEVVAGEKKPAEGETNPRRARRSPTRPSLATSRPA